MLFSECVQSFFFFFFFFFFSESTEHDTDQRITFSTRTFYWNFMFDIFLKNIQFFVFYSVLFSYFYQTKQVRE